MFKKLYYGTYAKNALIYNKLDEIVHAFGKENIELVLLKGCLLAENVYKDIGQRPMGDFDILIQKENLNKAHRILINLGYKKLYDKNKFIEKLQLVYNWGYLRDNQLLELHWDILTPHSIYSVNIQEFFSTKQKVRISNLKAFMFAPEFLLMHLCLHLNHNIHGGGIRLSWYVDIKKTCQIFYNEINWETLVLKCDSYKINEPVLNNLFISFKYFNAKIPEYLFKNGSFEQFEQLFLQLYKFGIQKKAFVSDLNYFKKIKQISGFANKIRFLWGSLFPSSEYLKIKYQTKFRYSEYLYYPVEMFLLIKKVSLSIFMTIIK